MTSSNNNLIWIDLEMTGLDTDNDHIIEIATIVTDSQLELVDEGPVFAIHKPLDILNAMDEWNQKQHAKSGLIKRVIDSRVSTEKAEAETLDFLRKHVAHKKSPMCGNSICQDRRFMHRLMPNLEDYFHYRNLDVSSLKELITRWFPEKSSYKKESAHLALNDIYDSINELKYYRKYFINS